MQQYAGVHLLQNYSTFFGCLSHPSSGVHQTVTAACGTGHITCQSNNFLPAWPKHRTVTMHGTMNIKFVTYLKNFIERIYMCALWV